VNLPPYSEATCGICSRELRENPAMHLHTVRVEEYEADRDGEFDEWMAQHRMSFHQSCVAKVLLQVVTMDRRDMRELLTGRPA